MIDKNLILMNCQETTKEGVIKKLANLAYEDNKINDINKYVDAVIARENEYSTGVGFGVAIPHGKSDAVVEPFLGFARVNNVDWHSLDGTPVNIVFIIGVPRHSEGSLHLKILASLSRKLMREEFRQSIYNIQNEDELLNLMSQITDELK